jgi:soluble lytic murein transglycosylase
MRGRLVHLILRFLAILTGIVALPTAVATAALARGETAAHGAWAAIRSPELLRRCVWRLLSAHWRPRADAIARTVAREAWRNGLDPVVVLAVIQHESRFSPTARGRHGEIGLMQIKPATAKWVAHECGLPWHGSRSLRDPIDNIRLGTAYLGYLKRQFRSEGLAYLSAYNLGADRLRSLLRRQVVPVDYVTSVARHYTELALQLGQTPHLSPG